MSLGPGVQPVSQIVELLTGGSLHYPVPLHHQHALLHPEAPVRLAVHQEAGENLHFHRGKSSAGTEGQAGQQELVVAPGVEEWRSGVYT